MNIELLCSDGSPLGVVHHDIYGAHNRIGVGGAELALLTLCEEWHKAGHNVVLYNNPRIQNASPFEQRTVASFDPNANRDVLIVFRSPNPKGIVAKGLKVWLSMDQYTIGDFAQFAPYMQKIVCISKYHARYFAGTYRIENTIVIDLPVRLSDYENNNTKRIQNRFIFNSVPDRGLQWLWRMWNEIKHNIPDATLAITSDYRLWGMSEPLNQKHMIQWIHAKDVEFLGAVPRMRMVEEQFKADINAYPCSYDELFCISCAENQVAGALPFTTEKGALETTNMGIVLRGDISNPERQKNFIERIVKLLLDRTNLERQRYVTQWEAKKRFAPENILKQWDEKVFNI